MQRFINEERFLQVCKDYEISGLFANHLRQLFQYKVVLVCDDSSSMKNMTNYGERRWDELCRFVQTVFSVTECIENSPLDVYFLNRASILGVQQLAQIHAAFVNPPSGWTPLVPVLRTALAQPYCPSYTRGRIFIICTDGEPTDEYNRGNTRQLYQLLEQGRRANDYVTFLACTDDDNSIDYLNRWDVQLKRCDVVDDFTNERREILWAQGRNFAFSYGDYVVKTLMGSAIPALDKLDEVVYDCRCTIS
jgi:hypothetical protein